MMGKIMTISLLGRTVEYELQRKKVKNINLRIKADGSIRVSAHPRVPLKNIEDFIRSNGAYILGAMDKLKLRSERIKRELDYVDGEMISVLGIKSPLRVLQGKRNIAEPIDGCIVLCVKDTENRELKSKTLKAFLEDVCRRAVNEQCERVYPTFKEMGVKYPTVKFRRMRTKWGICRPERGELTFSYMLAAAPVECIEYVVCHEFNHFIHPNHSKAFYESLERVLHDWKERKEKLCEVEMINQ